MQRFITVCFGQFAFFPVVKNTISDKMTYYSVKNESLLKVFCSDLSEPFKFKDLLQHLTGKFFCDILETYPNFTLEDIIIYILNQLTIQVCLSNKFIYNFKS